MADKNLTIHLEPITSKNTFGDMKVSVGQALEAVDQSLDIPDGSKEAVKDLVRDLFSELMEAANSGLDALTNLLPSDLISSVPDLAQILLDILSKLLM